MPSQNLAATTSTTLQNPSAHILLLLPPLTTSFYAYVNTSKSCYCAWQFRDARAALVTSLPRDRPLQPIMNASDDVEMADHDSSRSSASAGGGGSSKPTYAKRGKITIVACVPCRRRKTKVTRLALALLCDDRLTVWLIK